MLRDVELELLRRVIPEYAAAAARGQVELSTSPFYHPILPLLCDTDVHLRTHPEARVPRQPFRYPEDAAEQLARAVALHERCFGARPEGLWPPEGSVSDAIVPLVAEAGFRWMATDEEILARTLGVTFARGGDGHVSAPERLYRPYAVGPVACGFRDHALSDLIGFTYATWPAAQAAEDFLGRLRGIGHRAPGGVVSIILDGENAWEHYDGQGRPFLRALYGRLASHPEILTVTMREACAAPRASVNAIAPGSWINGDFYIWIGHPDDHRAWGQLAEARQTLEAARAAAAPEAVARAREELLIAEGSDWFWWYGDDHSSEHDLVFDELFRRHLRNAYRALEKPVPEDLFLTNITTRPPALAVEPPTGLIAPVVDGEVTSYFEWIGAGRADTGHSGGTMQQVADGGLVTLVEFGFDLERLFLRIDGTAPLGALLTPDVDVRLKFLKPAGLQAVVQRTAAGVSVRFEAREAAGGGWQPRACAGLAVAAGRILELLVPFACLGAAPGDRIAFLVAVNRGGAELEHHPRQGPIELDVPDARFPVRNWTV